MKKGKKIAIGIVAAVVVAGGVYSVTGGSRGAAQLPQVSVTKAATGDVEEIVDATGTVVSDEQKTFYSPVNAQVKKVSFADGDSVSKGTKLVEFELKDLERDNQKAELNVKSGEYDYKNSINKSNQADQKQKDAKSKVATLEQQVKDKQNYLASLKSQLSAVQSQAAADAQAAAQAQAAAEAQAKADAQAQAEAETQRAYAEALNTYQTKTLPAYQKELGELNTAYIKAQGVYNQTDTAYQMAFAQWQADPSDENAQALDDAEGARSQAEINSQQAKEAYEDKKANQPKMPEYADYSNSQNSSQSDLFTDGTEGSGQDAADQGSGSAETVSTSVDTSGIENAIEQASSDLADLQSDLATQKSIAEADSTSLTKEEKEKMRVTNNLTELDAKSAKELVEEGKKGIEADFNGVISKAAVQQGAAVTQGMELFTLQSTDKVSVDINVSKYDYAKVKEGQTADITIGDKKYTGKVIKISHLATTNEKGSTLISATVSIDQPDEDIFLGVDAKVKIYAEKAEDVVTLPAGVVNIGKAGSFCYVLKDGVITKQDITTGISSEDAVEVTDGIKAGDEVIEDLGSLEEGMAAEAVPADDDNGAADAGETANE
ncbi:MULTISPECIES: efflux RND transporter periplasmic adaptor subunit [Blautia]|uniref:efflux RND transporter periplasmic adaptor subunit n=1 Tax=Blautia TaxID=572511 RepID=UPI00156FDA9E|nr:MULTISPECIES: efflux RND transporter periplasmic adaptor subunit [Blautia]MCB5474634.1 efflux RND transporter periplasmic adaptor subunit [Blautia luti]NSK77097.1 efflux RND transporter periplasmic adaptor subunit [Blautia massiliensis (ex Durand et al. 2017)]